MASAPISQDNPMGSTALAERKPRDFPAMLTAWLPEIQRALPKHLSADRMARIALTAFRRTPKLGECDPRSVFACVLQSAQLGLEIDTLGRAYLVPYNRNMKTEQGWRKVVECQFIPGWKGLVDLMNRSGQGSVWTGAVFEGDEFDWQLGDSPFVRHIPRGEDDPRRITHTYAIGRVKGSDWPIIEVWPVEKVWRHRDRYNKVGDSHYSFENPEMYARKVPLLQVLKYMPCSAELATAIAMNDAAEVGHQGLTVKDAIDGSWTPAPEEHEETQGVAGEAKPHGVGRGKLREAAAAAARTAPPETDAGAAPYGPDDEVRVLLAIDTAKDRDEANAIVDACRSLPFYKNVAEGFNKKWAEVV